MGMMIGPFNPIKLEFEIINLLLSKGVITIPESRIILKKALDPKMSNMEKEEFIDSLINK